MKKYLLLYSNHVLKRNVKNSKLDLVAADYSDKEGTVVMNSVKNGEEFLAPACFRNKPKCANCAYTANFWKDAVKKETNSFFVSLLWRIFYRKKKFTWNSKK